MKKKILLFSLPIILSLSSCTTVFDFTSSSTDSTPSTSISTQPDDSSVTSIEDSSEATSDVLSSVISSDVVSENPTSETISSIISSEVISSETTSEEVSSEESSEATSDTTSQTPSSETSSEDVSSVTSSEYVSSNDSSSDSTTEFFLSSVISFTSLTKDQEISESNVFTPSGFTYVESYKVFGTGEASVRVGASKSAGYLDFSISKGTKIKSIEVSATTYGTDSGVGVEVSLSNGESKTFTYNGTTNGVFNFNGTSESNRFTVATIAKQKRVIIDSIKVNYYGVGSSSDVSSNNSSSSSSSSSSSGGNSGVTPITKESIVYNSNYSLTNGNMVDSKVDYNGYYKPAMNDALNIDEYAYWYMDAFLPSTGNPKVLVVPVDFSDYRAENKLGGEDSSQLDIYNTFFGESEDTGWESVRTFYEKSSYGALSLEGEVTPWYHSSYSTTTFLNQTYSGQYGYDDYYDVTWDLLDDVTSWAQSSLGIDISEYDTNDDGFIDAVWMVYACPQDYVDSEIDVNGVYWAYTYGNYDNYDASFESENVLPYKYAWASYHFMDEGEYGLPDAHTFIHETGHLLGLDDYYNYDSYGGGVCGGVDMMDYNIGDHNAYSKYLLNWTAPYVIDGSEDSVTISLKPFESSGEFILLADSFNDSPYDEYIMIEYYTPTGLNEQDTVGYSGLNTYTESGIKISHIDSRLLLDVYDLDQNFVESKYVEEFVDSNDYYYYYSIGANNTPSYSYNELEGDSPYRLIHLIEANNELTFNDDSDYDVNYGSNEVLFHTGDSFSLNDYSKFFENSDKLNNGNSLPYVITIGNENSDGTITITITKI